MASVSRERNFPELLKCKKKKLVCVSFHIQMTVAVVVVVVVDAVILMSLMWLSSSSPLDDDDASADAPHADLVCPLHTLPKAPGVHSASKSTTHLLCS